MLHSLKLVVLFLLAYSLVCAQDTNELERRNGFKDIKLGMVIDSVKGNKYKKDIKLKDDVLTKLYSVEDEEYSKIGEVAITKIEVMVYKGLVYEITVITDKDPRLMKALESIYGLSEYDIKRETYFWRAPSIVLKFRSHSKNHLEMVYTSPLVINLMKEDKGKKVQDIANDF